MPAITIRRATPDDAPALVRLFSGPQAIAGTMQIPYTSEESRRKRLAEAAQNGVCLLYTSPSPRDRTRSRMPSSA